MYTDMVLHAPDPDEELPLSNRRATMFGTTLTFLIIAWFAVFFRLYVRIRVVKELGWDDAFVFLAQSLNTAATVVMCLSVKQGLGEHMLYIGYNRLVEYLRLYYFEMAIYVTNCGVIKIALLLQYLRIFKAGLMRWICIGLLVAVTLWGIAFSITAWFPCFPVRGYWDRTVSANCYGFGLGDLDSFIATYKAQAATNMLFDISIFIAPMVLFRTPNLRSKNVFAMAGVFTFGAIVVGTSVWRLHGIVETKGATYPYVDYTWWSPTLIILTCLEIDLAIICASMPIFWPIIEKSLSAIFVSYEVQVVEERVDDYGLTYELEHMKGDDRPCSIKSSGTSTQELTNDDEESHPRRPQFTVGFDPLSEEQRNNGLSTNVQSTAQSKWQL
ncbi:uncharacterized protein J4E88_000769 [Alternaria novae-zelandiae]|uniref:uncharacterized protein n=1 Tax=Alternaria novae-zelandiae TaxID=430562 RepID=UPI0020C20D46|nr:uncharacterized protein J4E88_000769 [Alternaria novae-zelandiae]KAI4696592.1 hypothetical protein J4E88_000769 [Alternaria novae-zelandiae]